MVVEHSFVTSFDPPTAMRTASEFLSSRGFEPVSDGGFQVGSNQWDHVELRRGKKKAARAKSVSQLPTRALLQFDRGRVDVGLSIQPNLIWGRAAGLTAFGSALGKPKNMRLHEQLLTGIAIGLEQVLASGKSPAEAGAEWDAAEQAVADAVRKRRRKQIITLVIVGLFVAGIVALIVKAG